MSSHPTLGAHTGAEIQSQPERWQQSLDHLAATGEARRIAQALGRQRRWLFIGCGSSFYLAQTAAACWRAVTGWEARALPASELLLFPELAWDREASWQPVLISRSGATSEVLRAADFLAAQRQPFLAVTCTPGEALERRAAATLRPTGAEERSTVMTLSFTSMLLAIQYLGAEFAGDEAGREALRRMPAQARPFVDQTRDAVQAFVARHDFADYVWLGQGPYYGLACEGALKVQEMSCSYAQSFHTLEFRHGPKSIVAPDTLVLFQLSAAGGGEERGVLEEVKALGGVTAVVASRGGEGGRDAADLWLEAGAGGDPAGERAWLAPRLAPAQWLGLFTGRKKGLDSDHPRHLNRVVLLPQGG
ncbi:MAG: SIS domain-containing protein [Terriglobales bacterium]